MATDKKPAEWKNALYRMQKVISYVQPLDLKSWEAMAVLFRPSTLPRGGFLCREGEVNQKLAFVLSGVLRSYYLTPKGEEYNKIFFTENSFAVSLASAIQKVPSPFYFQALTDTSYLLADYGQLMGLFSNYPAIETLIRKLIEIEWIRKERREVSIGTKQAAELYQDFKTEFPGLEERIPLYHIASHLGITPVQLSRIRKSLREGEG